MINYPPKGAAIPFLKNRNTH